MGALGRRGRAASSGGAGAGRGKGGAAAARRDGGRPAAPRRALVRRGSPGSFRFSRGGCPALWGKRQRDGDGGGWSRLWRCLAPAPRLPAPPAPASPPRPAPPPRPRSRPRGEGHHLLTWAARTRGAAGGGALRAGRRRRGGSALWGQALGAQGGGTEACERRRWVESSFQDCRLRPGLVYANKVTKVSCGASRVDNSLRFCHPAAKPSPALLLTSSPSLK